MPNETYTLNYTAEQINHRLDLINENKNWLPYRYAYSSLSAGLEDVGDGSFLTTTNMSSQVEVTLATDYTLPEGSYIVSIDVTDITDTPVSNAGFSLKINGESKTAYTASTSPISISLVIPEAAEAGLLIKPMIRKSDAEAGWVPYMGKIDNYVDERFNSVNTKLRDVLAFMKLVEVVDV